MSLQQKYAMVPCSFLFLATIVLHAEEVVPCWQLRMTLHLLLCIQARIWKLSGHMYVVVINSFIIYHALLLTLHNTYILQLAI